MAWCRQATPMVTRYEPFVCTHNYFICSSRVNALKIILCREANPIPSYMHCSNKCYT